MKTTGDDNSIVNNYQIFNKINLYLVLIKGIRTIFTNQMSLIHVLTKVH